MLTTTLIEGECAFLSAPARAAAVYISTHRAKRCGKRPPRATAAGALALCAATLTGVATERLRIVPPALRGTTAAFLAGIALRNAGVGVCAAGAGASAGAAATAVLSHAPAGLALLLLAGGGDAAPSRALMGAFALGTLGSVLGAALGAVLALVGTSCGALVAAQLAAAFCATYIGGTLNFLCVAEATALPKPHAAAALTADLLLMAAYFALLLTIAGVGPRRVSSKAVCDAEFDKQLVTTSDQRGAAAVGCPQSPMPVPPSTPTSNTSVDFSSCVAVCALAAALHWGVRACALGAAGEVLAVTLAVMGVRAVCGAGGRKLLSRGAPAADIAVTLFFAALGCSVSLFDVTWAAAPALVVCVTTLTVHGLVMVWGRAVFGLDRRDVLVASNAAVGGPTTAAAFASAAGWRRLVGPAASVGALGYALGTPIALCLLRVLQVLL